MFAREVTCFAVFFFFSVRKNTLLFYDEGMLREETRTTPSGIFRASLRRKSVRHLTGYMHMSIIGFSCTLTHL